MPAIGLQTFTTSPAFLLKDWHWVGSTRALLNIPQFSGFTDLWVILLFPRSKFTVRLALGVLAGSSAADEDMEGRATKC